MKATDHLEVPSATEGLKMFILFHFNWFTFIYENIYLFAVLGMRPQTYGSPMLDMHFITQ